MIVKRTVYTTGQVGEICNVSLQTIIKWCDNGYLDHFVIPGSTHRRIVHGDLLWFMRKHYLRIPLELVDDR